MNSCSNIENLYRRPIQSKRTGPLYNAFSYPTKIDPEVIAVFLAAHTRPGDVVLDPFSGSGSTGVAARLCDQPTARMASLAKAAEVSPEWGPRRAVLYELSTLGALLARTMSNPPEPREFEQAAHRLIGEAAEKFGWAYEATGPNGELGQIRHVIWAEVLRTPCCGHRLTFWDAAVQREPVVLKRQFVCPNCATQVETAACERVVSSSTDRITGETIAQREWEPAFVYGRSPSGTWSRLPTSADLELIRRIRNTQIEGEIPSGLIDWGDLHRSGYHTGIKRFHHLYTDRNLRALAILWNGIEQNDGPVANALRLLVLSYNASHSTLMTRVVAKQMQKDFIITGAQSGVMYVSGLPVEKNILEGLRRKVNTFVHAFQLTYSSRSEVVVINGSSTRMDLDDNSVDYVFTDPPFGDFIPYAELNQVNESWMGALTDRTEEAIISPAQNKGVGEYAGLMASVFSETARVLRPTGAATVVFHASKPPVWHALGEAFRTNGFSVDRTSVLDKTQVSFKQVVHEGGTRGDALFLLKPNAGRVAYAEEDAEAFDHTISRLEAAAEKDPAELEPRRLYSRYVAHCVGRAIPVAISAPEFYARLSDRRRMVSQSA